MKQFLKEIKAKRLTKTWYEGCYIVKGKEVKIKGYKTWLQIYKVDGVDYSNCMERSVAEFNEDLKAPFKKEA